MQMVLNELSSTFPCESVEEGKRVMELFLRMYFQAKAVLGDDTILIDQDYQKAELAKGYPVAKWRNDKTIDIEIKRRFYRMMNHSITFTTEEFNKEASWLTGAEFNHCGRDAKGCLIAYERDDLVLSFLSESCWKCENIEGTYCLLDENGDIQIEDEDVTVPNVSYEENLLYFKKKYGERIAQLGKTTLKSGQDILKIHGSVLPNLVFCKNAEKQLENDIGIENVTQVYKKLLEIQKYIINSDDVFDMNALKHASPETDITLKHYKEEHTFILPDGRREVFSWHLRFTGPYAGRIFFLPDTRYKKCYIGHIGHKLPTEKYH